MTPSQTDPRSPSRRGRFPDPVISYAIGVMEIRRMIRKVRQQDIWLAMMGIGSLFLLLALPIVFGFAQEFGEELQTTGSVSESVFPTIFVIGWLAMVAFGLISGVGSDGEIDNQEAVLTIRPPKDIAGGLLMYVLLGYAPFVLPPGLAIAAGLALGIDAPIAIIGILLTIVCILISGVLVGYALGLVLKGWIRRSPWLTALKPFLGATVVIGYFWLSFTGRLFPILSDAGALLERTPLVWFVDLAFLTTPGIDGAVLNAVAVLGLTVLLVPFGVLASVRAGEYAWYVERAGTEEEEGDETTPEDRTDRSSLVERLDAGLGMLGVRPASRGVAVVVLLRGYRAPLQLVYVAVPFFFLIPILDTIVRTGDVPEWFPWMVILYGAWAAGAGFPLNILGNQGSTLSRLLTSPATGRQIVHGYLLATGIVFIPISIVLGVGSGHLAGRTLSSLVSVGLAGAITVVAGGLLGAGIGATFPRFNTVDLTDSTMAVLPSKFAFGLFSFMALLVVNSVGILADDVYRIVVSTILSEHLPYGITVTEGQLEFIAMWIAVIGTIAVPVAYFLGSRRISAYRVS
jgi:ABC-2 type transport system permease protein